MTVLTNMMVFLETCSYMMLRLHQFVARVCIYKMKRLCQVNIQTFAVLVKNSS